MSSSDTLRVAFSGGPGSGKTSTLNGLQELGFSTIPESARTIIAERKARGLAPRPPAAAFARALAACDIEKHNATRDKAGFVFFDRSLVDSLLMLQMCGVLEAGCKTKQLDRYPYHKNVFFFPPWRAIYRLDNERDQDFQEALSISAALREWYAACGYNLIEMPLTGIEARCQFVLDTLALKPGNPALT